MPKPKQMTEPSGHGPSLGQSAMASLSGSAFSNTLHEITNIKLEELSKRRAAFEHAKTALLSALDEQGRHQDHKAPSSRAERLEQLTAGVKRAFGVHVGVDGNVVMTGGKYAALESELRNLDRFLTQARHDPSVSARMLGRWEESLLRHVEIETLRYTYASLYGQLVTEWLSVNTSNEEALRGVEDVEMSGAFDYVESAERLKSRTTWERTVFEPSGIDVDALNHYLSRLFGVTGEGKRKKKAASKALNSLRSDVAGFEARFATNAFTTRSLRWVIDGLLSSNRISDDKKEVLRDFQRNAVILAEIADVLNMRLASLDSWSWGAGGVPVEQRRKVNGTYSIHLHDDLLQAMFLQYIGVTWSVFLKKTLRAFRKAEGAWASNRAEIPLIDRKRLGYYLGPVQREPCLQSMRKKEYRRRYFVTQLMDSERSHIMVADGEEEANYQVKSSNAGPGHPARGAKRHRVIMEECAEYGGDIDDEAEDSNDDDDEDGDQQWPKNPMELKQRLLHLLSAEIAIGTRLHGEITALHSVFESWDELLAHQTVRTILAFFGVSDVWLDFFSRFLEAPLKFLDEDISAEPRIRRRGTPPGHALSDVFAEVVLFCLDFAINQETSGHFLWRVRDDFWFWASDHQTCVKAWGAVTRFAVVTGSTLNAGKTGAARIVAEGQLPPAIDASLPEGQIRWGFLYLSPETGRFTIDQDMVDIHITELRRQLQDKTRSVFAFVQAWNTYVATFFTSNFGVPANCFGRAHVDEMLQTHERVQRQIFSTLRASSSRPGSSGSADRSGDQSQPASIVDFLKAIIHQRFGVADVPDGYFFFPVELGGLGLVSPFVSLLQQRDTVLESPALLFAQMLDNEQAAYARAKAVFDSGAIKTPRFALDDPDWVPLDPADHVNFMDFNEYVRWREEFNFERQGIQVHHVFKQLMQRPRERSLEGDRRVTAALTLLSAQANAKGITSNWYGMEPYWKWVATMYGPEILDWFGVLNIVDPGLLPMGMVSLFRERRVRWQG